MTNDYCIRCLDNKADANVCLRDDIKTTLKSAVRLRKAASPAC